MDKSEQERIKKIATDFARSENEIKPYSERLNSIKDAVEQYFSENSTIVPAGFVDFRLREVYYNIEEIVSYSAERFFEEKEIEEFTNLLSKLVAEKEPKEELMHVVWKTDCVRLLNKRGRDVTKKYEKEFYSMAAQKGLGEEDLAISALISAAPKRLVFHSPPPASPLKETLELIFKNRCKVCLGCKICEKA